MDVLFLSHCTPDAPDKGEKIRAFHELASLTERHRVHLVCFARSEREVRGRELLERSCASVYIERLSPLAALPRTGLGFALGASLVGAAFRSRPMMAYLRRLSATRTLDACLAFSSVMAAQAPAGLPLVCDMVDVDSEKWFAYAALRRPASLFAAEARRLRRLESAVASRAHCVFLSTAQEVALYRSFAPAGRARALENGVDADYFDPAATTPVERLSGRRYLLFVGAMGYYPNREAVIRFARREFPLIRDAHPDLEFLIVGRQPSGDVVRLDRLAGVTVIGEVPDVRPYLESATAVLAPLRIARGVQNKVLEALAMGKPVIASRAIARTFGERLPEGVRTAFGAAETLAAVNEILGGDQSGSALIRQAARNRFQWQANMKPLLDELDAARPR